MSTTTWTSADVCRALRDRFPKDEYALFFEVRNGTGFQRKTRSADALAMSLWPSRGLEFHGFEVKVSRSDWLRELKEPAKAEEIARFCHRWWVVAGDPKIVRADELPPTWGLIERKGDALAIVKQAPPLTPEPLSMPMLASLLRSAQSVTEDVVASRVGAEVTRRIDAERKAWAEREANAEAVFNQQVEELRRRIDAFEAVSGLRIDRYDGPKLAAAVKAVREGGVDRMRADALRAIEELKGVIGKADLVIRSEAA